MKQIRIIIIAVFLFIFFASSMSIRWDLNKKQKDISSLIDGNMLYVFEIVRHGARAPLIDSKDFPV